MAATLTGTNRGKGGLAVDDGTTEAYGVDYILFSSGATLTDNGNGRISIAISGGGGGGGTVTSVSTSLSGISIANPTTTPAISGTLGVASGGTALTSYTTGDVVYASAATTLSSLGIGGAGELLSVNAGATAPEWSGGSLTWNSSTELLTSTYGKQTGIIEVKAGATITKGQAVYITGYDSGSGKPTVGLAQADNASTMPSIGIAVANISSGSVGFVAYTGQLNNIDLSGIIGVAENDTLYVSPLSAGDLTNIKPVGATELIQNVGRVLQTGASGKIAVSNIGRTNDVPNTISVEGTITSTSGNITTSIGNISASVGDVNGATVTVNTDLEFSVDGTNTAIIRNSNANSDIVLRVNDGGFDSDVVLIDGANSRVGVNQSTPTVDFQVSGESRLQRANVLTVDPSATPISYSDHAGAYINLQGNPEMPPISSVGEQYVLINTTVGPLTISASAIPLNSITGSTTISADSAVTIFAIDATTWFVIG